MLILTTSSPSPASMKQQLQEHCKCYFLLTPSVEVNRNAKNNAAVQSALTKHCGCPLIPVLCSSSPSTEFCIFLMTACAWQAQQQRPSLFRMRITETASSYTARFPGCVFCRASAWKISALCTYSPGPFLSFYWLKHQLGSQARLEFGPSFSKHP